MIWILWLLFIGIETVIHYFIIEIIQYDLTPDQKLITLSKALVIFLRGSAFFVLWSELGIHHNAEFWCYFSGALFSHLLIFPILLNVLRGKPIHYLGQGTIDNILNVLPFIFRVWCLLVLSAGAMYAYFNTDLL